MRRALIVFPVGGWLPLAALAHSFSNASDTCGPDAFWTTGWFFAPPALAVPGFLATAPTRAGSLLASVALLAIWGLFFLAWFASAIAFGT